MSRKGLKYHTIRNIKVPLPEKEEEQEEFRRKFHQHYYFPKTVAEEIWGQTLYEIGVFKRHPGKMNHFRRFLSLFTSI